MKESGDHQKMDEAVDSINQQLQALINVESQRSKRFLETVLTAIGIALTALIAIVSAIWIAVVNPLADKIKDVAANAASRELTAREIAQLEANSASKEVTDQRISELQRSVARIEAQMVTKDQFQQWLGKANRELR